jgi:hypothetical protein
MRWQKKMLVLYHFLEDVRLPGVKPCLHSEKKIVSEFKYLKLKGTIQPDKIGLRMIPLQQSWLVIHRRLNKFEF